MKRRHGSRTETGNTGTFFSAVGLLAGAFLAPESEAAVRLGAPEFKAGGAGGTIVLKGDADFTAVKDEQAKDNQVVFEISGATLEKGAEREVPTSSFQGSKLKLVKAYSVSDKPETVRLVLQLSEATPVEMKQDGKTLTVQVGSAGGGAAAAAPGSPDPVPGAASEATTPPAAAAAPEAAAPPAEVASGAQPSTEAPPTVAAEGTPTDVPSNPEGKQIESFVASRKSGSFSGKPISIQVRDGEISDVLNLIGEASGFNMVLSDNVKGKVNNLSLIDVPWDQALDVVLRMKQLGAERNHNILRIMTLQELTTEKQTELNAKRLAQAAAQKVYRVFRPSYITDLTQLQTRLLNIINASLANPGEAAGGGGGGGGAGAGQTLSGGTLTIDTRTNSLIAYDNTDTLEMIAKVIAVLDRPIAQLLIETRVVEASETFSKTLSGQLGAVGAEGAIAFNGDPSVSAFLGATGTGLGSGSSISIAAQPTISFIPGFNRLSALLNLSESETQVKTVSNPKTVTLEDSPTNITVTTPVPVANNLAGNGVGGVPGTNVVPANLSMVLTPKVLADGSILFRDLNLTAAEPVPDAGALNRTITTSAVIENGSTLLVGGVYKNSETFGAVGIPLLRNIPLLGWLFGTEAKGTSRSELLFFLTPRILNEKQLNLGKPVKI
jgi:type IV pilus assembly protein PilQ